jgi:hypothetical protein
MYGRRPYATVAYAQFYEIVAAAPPSGASLVFQAQTLTITLKTTGNIKVILPIQ